jgi:tetratricopeptide (TPR) repeat protein
MGYGLILMLEEELEQAEKEFNLGLSLGPTQAELRVTCATFCMKKREYQKALASLRRARELARPGLALWLSMEAGALSALRRWEEAFAIAKRAVEAHPGGLDLWAMCCQQCS